MTRQDPAPLPGRDSLAVAPAAAPADAGLTQQAVLLANRMLAGIRAGDTLLVCGLTQHRGVGALALLAMRAAAGLSGLRVVAVEAQAVHPASTAAPAGGPGFTDVLAGAPLLPAMLHAGPGGALRVMGVGTRPALAGAGALMGVQAAAAVAALHAEADLVCLIGAPLRGSVGTSGLAKAARASVLCVHRGIDRREDVAQAATDIAAAGSALIGTVLMR